MILTENRRAGIAKAFLESPDLTSSESELDAWVNERDWEAVSTIAEIIDLAVGPDIDKALEIFNSLASEHLTPRLRTTWKDGQVVKVEQSYNAIRTTEGTEELGYYLCIIAEHFFAGNGWRRVKRCPQCLVWFADESKNMRRQWCSTKCGQKWWTPERRAAAGHKKQRKFDSKEVGSSGN